MKKLIFLLLATLTFVACGTSRSAREKAVMNERKAQQVSDSLERRTFTIHVDYINPLRFPAYALTSPYSLRVEGDSLISYLPYVGEARMADYNYESPLNFTARILAYTDQLVKSDRRRIRFEVRNRQELFDFYLDVFDNGSANVHVVSDYRDAVDFTGELDVSEQNTHTEK